MRLFKYPNFFVMAFTCQDCKKDTSISVHDDGAAICNSCGIEAKPPMYYQEALRLHTNRNGSETHH